MRFDKAILDLSREVGKSSDDAEIKLKLKAALNTAKLTVGKAYHWKELKTYGELVLIPDYTDGAVSITQDSRTVTGSGTAWTSAMVGRFFRHANTGLLYRIISVQSATQLTLQSPIVESSASGLSYLIRKRFYRVNTDIRIVLPDEKSNTMDIPFTVEGYDSAAQEYSTGTVSITKDSNILTGSGTSFLDNCYPGDLITVSNNNDAYIVKTVDSNTQITMVNKATASLSGRSYSISTTEPIQAELTIQPTTKTILPYFYIRHLYNMVNDADTTELSNKFDRVFMDFAKAEYGRIANTPQWTADLEIAQARLETLKQNSSLVWYPYRTFPPSIPAGNGRGVQSPYIDPLYPQVRRYG